MKEINNERLHRHERREEANRSFCPSCLLSLSLLEAGLGKEKPSKNKRKFRLLISHLFFFFSSISTEKSNEPMILRPKY
jgi:hypothetical protein